MNACGIDKIRTFLKKAENSFTYEMVEKMVGSESFRLRNVEETSVPNEVGGPSYKIMRNFTKTDYQFDFGSFDIVTPNSHDSGCLTDEGNPCNMPATQVGGSGWQTQSWAYFREKLRTPRHCIEEFRDIPEAGSYLQEMLRHLPEIANDRLDMFFRGLEYYYSTKHILTGNGIREIARPGTTVAEVEATVNLVDCDDDVLSTARLTPRNIARIYTRALDLYGREMALGFKNGRPFYGLTASDELIEYYHIDNPEIFDEIKASDRVNPLIEKYGLSQVLGQKIVHINDEDGYRANLNADGSLTHVAPYQNIKIDSATGAGYETIRTQDWRQADLEYALLTGAKQFTLGYQDAFQPIAGDEMQEIGKRFDWRMYNKADCNDEDANWFHMYATARFYVRPNFRKSLAGFYFPVNPERLDAKFFGNGSCPEDITECAELKRTCEESVIIEGCCDHPESKKLLVTFDQDIYASLGITDAQAGFIVTRDGDHLPVVIEAQSAKNNNTFVVDFTTAGITGEPCCADGEMIEFYVTETNSDSRTDYSNVYDACPAAADFTTYTLFLERALSCVAENDELVIVFSDGSTATATSTGTYDPIARTLVVTPTVVLTPDKLCQKYIVSVGCAPLAGEASDISCDSLVDQCPSNITALDFVTASFDVSDGGNIDATVTFDEAVVVTGTPVVTATNDQAGGGTAATVALNYLSGTGTNTLTFRAVVAGGGTTLAATDELTLGANVLSLNGGTIVDTSVDANVADITNAVALGTAAGVVTVVGIA